LFVNSEACQSWPGLNICQATLNNRANSRQSRTLQKDESKALSLYYRGAILNRLARYDEARASLDEALRKEGLDSRASEKGESPGNSAAGMKRYGLDDAVQRNAHLALANNELAGAARASGKLDEADLL